MYMQAIGGCQGKGVTKGGVSNAKAAMPFAQSLELAEVKADDVQMPSGG
jgi:hypothetical protein